MDTGKAEKDHVFKKRFYQFVLRTVRLIDGLPNDNVSRRLGDQLLRSASSIIANYIEGQAAASRKDFANFLTIALKSANESKVWFALLRDTERCKKSETDWFLMELDEIGRILGASVVTLKRQKG